MHENLMTLPLFKGVSYNRISEIVGKIPLAFSRHSAGASIALSGEPCRDIRFVIGGSVRIKISNHTERFRILQTLTAPAVIFPDFLFGRATSYPGDVTAIGDVSIMQIAKNDFISLLRDDEIILFNFLNMLSANAQKSVSGVLALTDGSLEERIAFWIEALTQIDASDILLQARQHDLSTLFGVPRSSFVDALESLRQRGVIEYTPTEIRVISRKSLRSLLIGNI